MPFFEWYILHLIEFGYLAPFYCELSNQYYLKVCLSSMAVVDMMVYMTKCISPINPLVFSQTVLTVFPFWDESASPVAHWQF